MRLNECAEFERCWPWLEASLNEFGATHTKDQVWETIYRGAILWPGEGCELNGPSCTGAILTHCATRSLKRWSAFSPIVMT